jgi:hypothetical protein
LCGCRARTGGGGGVGECNAKRALVSENALEHMSYNLKGKVFRLVTDHKALEFLNEKQSKNAKVFRWGQSEVE